MTVKTLPIHEIEKLGYTIREFQDLGVFPETLREHPLQVVSGKFIVNGKTILQGIEVKIKPGTTLVMDLMDFILLWNGSKGQAITGTKLLKDNYSPYYDIDTDLTNKRLLLWSFGCGFGDLLFMQTILRSIKDRYPTSIITWALPQIYHSFVRSFNVTNKIISTPFDIKYILENDYHLHFDGLISSFESGKTVNCYELMANSINLEIPKPPVIEPNKQSIRYIKDKLIKDFIILHLQTSTPMRNPREEFKLDILNRLLSIGFNVGFVDSSVQKMEINNLISKSINPNNCYNFAGITRDMNDVAVILNMAKLVVSVDTSIIHIATAVGTPIYGLYGPFPGRIRLATYNNCKWVDGVCDISPCCLHQQELCHKAENGHPICYDNIDLDKVIIKIKTLI